MALSAFGQEYKKELKSLTATDRLTINFLRSLAKDNANEHQSIIVAVQQQLYECPQAQQLPLLYLVDCIIKTVGEPYISQFCPALPGMFRYVWDGANASLVKSLAKLAATWNAVLPAYVVAQVNAITAVLPPGAQHGAPAAPFKDSRLMAPAKQQPLVQPHAVASSSYGRQPLPQAHGAALGPAQHHYPQPHNGFAQLQQQQPPSYIQQQQQFAQPPQQQQQFAQHPQQQQQLQLQQYGGQNSPSAPMQAAPSTQDLMAQLLSLGSRLGATAVQPGRPASAQYRQGGASTSAPASSGSGQQQRRSAAEQQPLVGKVSGSLIFNPSLIKEHDPSAVEELLDASNQTRRKFLDVQFLRNRRIKSAQASSQPLSQQWFYTIDQWLVGTRPDADDVDALLLGPEDEDGDSAQEPQPAFNVEEDPSQPECAISGETFERWYDPDSDKWFYSDAVLLTGDEAAKYGVMDGSIVKVHCLAGQPSKLKMASMGLASSSQAAWGDGKGTKEPSGVAEDSTMGSGTAAAAAAGDSLLGKRQTREEVAEAPGAVATSTAPAAARKKIKAEPA